MAISPGSAKVWLPIGLVLGNALFWLTAVALTPPLPPDYFSERDGRLRAVPGGGIQFDLRSDVDPLLILAERPFLWPLEERLSPVWVAALANLPATFASAALTEHLGLPQRVGDQRYRRASWYGTLAFGAVATAQWLLVGALIAWRISSRPAS